MRIPATPLSALLAVAIAAAPVLAQTAQDRSSEQQPKPVPPDEVLTSRIAGEQHDNAVEAWGEEGWATVGRLCRFFDEMGMRGLSCPPPTARPREPG